MGQNRTTHRAEGPSFIARLLHRLDPSHHAGPDLSNVFGGPTALPADPMWWGHPKRHEPVLRTTTIAARSRSCQLNRPAR